MEAKAGVPTKLTSCAFPAWFYPDIYDLLKLKSIKWIMPRSSPFPTQKFAGFMSLWRYPRL